MKTLCFAGVQYVHGINCDLRLNFYLLLHRELVAFFIYQLSLTLRIFFFPIVFPALKGQLPDAPSPMPPIKGIFLYQTSFLHIIFHLISPSSSLSPSRSSSSSRFLPSPPHPLLAIHPQHMPILSHSYINHFFNLY